ncbi:hypothetical protein A0H81_05698 [Grifola frondosa]|uniref:Alpha/beta-hydrolase n=1 Tax=Grifola frondosa TaxID=5627 RepID=A0A1C7MCT9_GRIFR|nr:hypothetical protein A0H81_05698 [Grifola frondosa]
MSKDSQNPLHLNSLHSQMIYSTTLTIFSMVFGVLAGHLNLKETKDMLHDCGSQSGVEWGSCDVESITVTNPNLTCGFFEIPLDYHNSSAGNGRIFVVKMNATLERRGTLFTNPGGPGGSGIDWVDSTGEELLNFTGGHYDIVSWDPRGVGPASIPGEVYCFDNMTDYEAFWNGTIELTGIEMTGNFTNQTDLDNLFSQASIMDQKYRELGQRCLQHQNGTYLKYIGTAATARDMAALADALDGPGSPRVGHFIIDGVVNTPALAVREPYTYWGTEIGTSDTVFDGFATGCALSGPQECNLTSAGQSGTDVVDYIQSVLIDFANQILAINISQVAEESNHSLSPGFLTKAVERRR